jgi:hypothetical protein
MAQSADVESCNTYLVVYLLCQMVSAAEGSPVLSQMPFTPLDPQDMRTVGSCCQDVTG